MDRRQRELEQVFTALGLSCTITVTGGNHYKVVATHPDGRTGLFFAALTPGDHRSRKNFEATVRRHFNVQKRRT